MKKTATIFLIFVIFIQMLSVSGNNIQSSTLELPQTPTNVIATSTESSITVSWSEVEGAINYDVRINGSVNTTSRTSYTYTGLAQDSDYEYSVRAKNDLGSSAYSVSKTIKTLKKVNIPTGIRGTSDESSVTISWTPINEATGYEIKSGDTILSSTLSTVTFNDLLPDTTYSYSVRAIVLDRKSQFSSTINVRTQKLATTPVDNPLPIVDPVDPITPDEVVETEPNVDTIEEINANTVEEINNIDEGVIEITETDPGTYQEVVSMIAKPIITTSEIEFIHMVNTEMTISWINGEGDTPDGFSLELFDDSGYLIFSNGNIGGNIGGDIDGGTYSYILPKDTFNHIGKYYLELIGYKENENSIESQEVINVLDKNNIIVLTKPYDKYTNKSYILQGIIEALNYEQIVEYGFYWGNTIVIDNVQTANNIDEMGEFSIRLPQTESNHKYYYKAFARKRNGEYVYGEVFSVLINDIERGLVPIIHQVISEINDEDTKANHLTIVTDSEVIELLIIDQNGSVIKYKDEYKDEDDLRIWGIDRFYPIEGIYEEEIYAYGEGAKSEGFMLNSLIGIRDYNPIKTKFEKTKYQYFMRNNELLTIDGLVYTTNSDDYITSISYCINDTTDEQDCILFKEVNDKEVELEQDEFSVDPHSFKKNSTGIHSILIYATTDLNEEQQFLVAEITINCIDSIRFVDMKTEYDVFADESIIQLTGSIRSADDTYIEEVNLITNISRENIYKESALSNVHREVIDLNEKIDLVFVNSKFQTIRVLILLSDGSIVRKDIGVYLSLLTMGVPDEVDINEDLFVRIYSTREDGSRSIIKNDVKLSIGETDIAKLVFNKLRTLKEGTLVITATLENFNNQITTSQVLNITKKDR